MFDISNELSTKTIKRLYYYSMAVFDLYLSMIALCISFFSLTSITARIFGSTIGLIL